MGKGRPMTQPGLHVDYKDVLEQAVANERWRVLRDVRDQVEKIDVSERRSYSEYPRNAEQFKGDALAALRGIENGGEK